MSANSKSSIILFLAKTSYLFIHIGVGLLYIHIFFDMAQYVYPETQHDLLTTVSLASITTIWCSWGWDVKNSFKKTTTSYEFLCLKLSRLFEGYILVLLFVSPVVFSYVTDASVDDTFNIVLSDGPAIGALLCVLAFRPLMTDMFAHPHELASRQI